MEFGVCVTFCVWLCGSHKREESGHTTFSDARGAPWISVFSSVTGNHSTWTSENYCHLLEGLWAPGSQAERGLEWCLCLSSDRQGSRGNFAEKTKAPASQSRGGMLSCTYAETDLEILRLISLYALHS